jgi:uncharacterized protein (TIGR03437 family)
MLPAHALTATVAVPLRPVAFEPNVGQTDTCVKYLAHSAHSTLWLTEKGAVLETAAGRGRKSGNVVLNLRFAGANPAPHLEAEDPRTGVSNYFLGRDPQQWHTGVPQFGKVRYRNVYPGIDAVFYGNAGELEYDFVVRPGADPGKIRLAFDGADRVRADAAGDLVVSISGVQIRSRKPRIYQKATSGEQQVSGHYTVLGKRRAGFAIDDYDPARPLVVDPVLSYASFLGGTGSDIVNAMTMDAQGNVYLAGSTNSGNFPRKNAIYPGVSNALDVAFVSKFNLAASGADSLVYSTFLGGNVSDEAFGIALDSSGNVYVTGRTLSTDFPLKHAFQTSFSTATNCTDAAGNATACEHSFITEIAAAENALVYSSYLGGSNQDEALAIGVDSAGNAYITGRTTSTDFPTAGSPYQSSQKGTINAFLCKVAPKGTSLAYSTYFGGTDADAAVTMAVAPSGTVYIAGSAGSTNLPTTSNAYQAAQSGGPGDAFVAVFNLNQTGSSSLTYSTYLGATDGTTVINGITVDAAGVIYLTGATNADDFPVSSGAFRKTYAGSYSPDSDGVPGVGDAFITKLNPSASGSAQLVYSTYLGGAFDDEGFGIAVDSLGHITVAGQTNSSGFPVTGNAIQGFDAGPSPTNQGFIARFDPSKSGTASLLYSTFLGGDEDDGLFAVAVNSTGTVVVAAGAYASPNPPITPSAFQPTYGGGSSNAYIAEINFTESGPVPRSVVNGASLVDTGLSPGLIFTIRGSGFGPSAPEQGGVDVNGRIPTTLDGVQVMVDDTPAPLLYVSADQINAVAPYELANRLGGNVTIQVYYNGIGGNLISDTAVIASPAVFTSGNGQGIILNQDGSLNGPGDPAPTGSTVRIFATGEGLIQPAGVDGEYVGFQNTPQPVLPVVLMIGGVNATITNKGTVPGLFEGFFEVDAIIPAGAPAGNNPVVLIVGGIQSTPVNVVVK